MTDAPERTPLDPRLPERFTVKQGTWVTFRDDVGQEVKIVVHYDVEVVPASEVAALEQERKLLHIDATRADLTPEQRLLAKHYLRWRLTKPEGEEEAIGLDGEPLDEYRFRVVDGEGWVERQVYVDAIRRLKAIRAYWDARIRVEVLVEGDEHNVSRFVKAEQGLRQEVQDE